MAIADESLAETFIERWKKSEAAEQANSQLFLRELCEVLEVPAPEPTVQDELHNNYVFEKRVVFQNGDGTTNVGRIDLYKSGCFVLESKQGSDQKEPSAPLSTAAKNKKHRAGTAPRGTPAWQQAMTRARNQAERYAKALPVEAGWPPFLVVADVGFCFDLYSDFSQSGKAYTPFPDPQSYRIRLDDLADPQVRTKLRGLWLDPLGLDPSRRAAKVTRELAGRLAKLAKSLEGKHSPEAVANFLIRCLFTMFAEDVELLPRDSFVTLLERARKKPAMFIPWLEELWRAMNEGKVSTSIGEKLLHFNGGLFAECTALPVNEDQLELLIEAAEARWTDVEPAIFGTLLERALDPVERHKLGAHYTPRAYVERLVMPTIIEPLRAEWESVYATAVQLESEENARKAREAVRAFHHRLCEVRVLDPACGSGNFLYVALEHMKRLEGEVLNALREFGEQQIPLLTIDPHQFLGIEVNPRAAAITDLVLWIGFLQWHFRTRGRTELPEPVLRDYQNIECRDAVLAWDAVEDVHDEQGNPVTRWDGRTTKPHPVTGEEVPDETARTVEKRYINPRKAEWPKCD
ncbi:MAG: class I SAM-dependent DNA methyltransferase, partial [Planctomycetes bacterium]|nr:class I SAM-dependent DNA methyltransferase [Planctomycetota bacterium]